MRIFLKNDLVEELKDEQIYIEMFKYSFILRLYLPRAKITIAVMPGFLTVPPELRSIMPNIMIKNKLIQIHNVDNSKNRFLFYFQMNSN